MRTKPCLTLEDANLIVAACKQHAAAKNWPVTIVVVDDAGIPLQLERLDGAMTKTVEIASLKAATSATLRFPSAVAEELVKARPGFVKVSNTIPLQGAVPIMVKGECVGAVGVSGVQSFEDEEIAKVGLAALKLD